MLPRISTDYNQDKLKENHIKTCYDQTSERPRENLESSKRVVATLHIQEVHNKINSQLSTYSMVTTVNDTVFYT